MNLFFDFDGVILDSLDIKELGFRQIFKKYNKKDIEKIIEFHNKNLGKSRFIKIKYFYQIILKKEISSNKINSYSNKFSKIMRDNLNNKSRLINDSLNYIKKNYRRNKLFIVSGTEENELIWLCKKLNLSKYFFEIKGSPTSKEKLVSHIINKYSLVKSNSILIGDSLNDYDAAKYNEIKFHGYNNIKLNCSRYNYIKSMNNLYSTSVIY